MKNRWEEKGAQEALSSWEASEGRDVALRLYSARLLGSDRTLVLHGGGNVSVKTKARDVFGDEVDVLRIKGSGHDLADLGPEGLPAVAMADLGRLLTLEHMTDAGMKNELRLRLLDAMAPTPSIETLVHAAIPAKFVDHSHADALLAITNQSDGEKKVKEALGDRVAILPYVFPGFELARAMAASMAKSPEVEGVVLLHHGLFTFGDDAETSYRRHVELIGACEEYLEKNGKWKPTPSPATGDDPAELAARIAPILRGLLAEDCGDDRGFLLPILEWRASDEIQSFVDSEDGEALAAAGPVTTDHLIRTGKVPLFLSGFSWGDEDAMRSQLEKSLSAYAIDHEKYVRAGADREGVEPPAREAALGASHLPRVVLIPGAGAFCFGRTKRDARIAADVTEQTIAIKIRAHAIGEYTPLSDDHLFDMEFRSLQLDKLGAADPDPLARRVVVISGGAGAIGASIALTCARAGGHVVVTDVNEERIDLVVQKIEEEVGAGRALGLVMNVTDETSVQDGFAEICRRFGGVDVLVPNAGIAHVSPVDQLALDDFKRVVDVNLNGYLTMIKEGVRILKQQGRGGHVVINASKNVFGPGKDFGAYSASKAAGHQLGKVAAIELAPENIRVNMINADAVFGDPSIPSGLWQEVGPGRAKSRGMKTEDLPEYYRKRNLLQTRVYGHHVGNAVVYFASNQSPTTGATLPVDGGLPDAFPR